MKKVIQMQDLDCANCAAKMEKAITKIEGVISCSINFMMQKMTLEIDDNCAADVLDKVRAAVKKVEPDCKLKI